MRVMSDSSRLLDPGLTHQLHTANQTQQTKVENQSASNHTDNKSRVETHYKSHLNATLPMHNDLTCMTMALGLKFAITAETVGANSLKNTSSVTPSRSGMLRQRYRPFPMPMSV